jgi:subtilisin family serine protease
MNAPELVNLSGLMRRTSGSREVIVGLIDGPVAMAHPDLNADHLRETPGRKGATCDRTDSLSCLHGTFVAGILAARRGSAAPAICPGCTVVIRPIFLEAAAGRDAMPSASADDVVAAIMECIDAGSRVVNLSLALVQPSRSGERALGDAFSRAAANGVIVVAAAGNEGTLGSSAITRDLRVIPVAACDGRGRPLARSNLGLSIGSRGLAAPGDRITSLGADGVPLTLGGTSAAAPFVTGAIALMWSEFPKASATEVRLAILGASRARGHSVVPPLLDAGAAHRMLARSRSADASPRIYLPVQAHVP